jgi:hypothetical protein
MVDSIFQSLSFYLVYYRSAIEMDELIIATINTIKQQQHKTEFIDQHIQLWSERVAALEANNTLTAQYISTLLRANPVSVVCAK